MIDQFLSIIDIVKYICPDGPASADVDVFSTGAQQDPSEFLIQDQSLTQPSDIKQELDFDIGEQLLLSHVNQGANPFSVTSPNDSLLSSLPGNKQQTLNLSQLSSAQQLQQAVLKLQAQRQSQVVQQQKQAQQQQLLQLLLQYQQQQRQQEQERQKQQQQNLTLTPDQLKLLLLEYQHRQNKNKQLAQAVQQPQAPVHSSSGVTIQQLQQVFKLFIFWSCFYTNPF